MQCSQIATLLCMNQLPTLGRTIELWSILILYFLNTCAQWASPFIGVDLTMWPIVCMAGCHRTWNESNQSFILQMQREFKQLACLCNIGVQTVSVRTERIAAIHIIHLTTHEASSQSFSVDYLLDVYVRALVSVRLGTYFVPHTLHDTGRPARCDLRGDLGAAGRICVPA